MKAGTLRTLIKLQRPTQTTSTAWGPAASTWAAYATVNAAVIPTSAGEQGDATQIQSAVHYTVTIRYRPDVLSTDRILIVSTSVILDIAGIVNTDMRNQEMVISAVEHKGAP